MHIFSPRTADRMLRDVVSLPGTGRCELHVDFAKTLNNRIHTRVFGLFAETLTYDRLGQISLSYLSGSF